jgi:hypothetical protein
MPLDRTILENAVKAAFKKAKDTPPPENPADADKIQEQILTDLSRDLANAVNTFVQSGDVTQVAVQVTDDFNNQIGKGIQTGVGKIL